MSFKGKHVLVAGGTGMIGLPLVELLLQEGARVRVASLDDPVRANNDTEFVQIDLTSLENCLKVCKGIDFVFNLLGVKGSPAVTTKKPASFLYPTAKMELNMLEASRIQNVSGYMFTSSIAVYSPASIFYEDDVWKSFPSPNDWFSGWSKRFGELQVESYKIEYSWKDIFIVRPANVYGPFDNFDGQNAMVVPSLIRKALSGESPMNVWGDGSAVRDFIHARDVAEGMLILAKKKPAQPVNIGSGEGLSIKELVHTIISNVNPSPSVYWDKTKPVGDEQRVMDMSRANTYGFKPKISLHQGIKEVIEWYLENKNLNNRYDVFNKNDR